ncbi:Dabb family protein [Pseudomonas tolaasii]|uniref:Dabb family protein n=1 Tax=Pseudomonas tolaasii TaxID=29442 RepID=UPI001C606E7B|nr:Dabb family protein [Pseudomonas tolaasii]
MLDFHLGSGISPVSLSQGFTHAFTIDFQNQAYSDGYWAHRGHIAVTEQLRPYCPRARMTWLCSKSGSKPPIGNTSNAACGHGWRTLK